MLAIAMSARFITRWSVAFVKMVFWLQSFGCRLKIVRGLVIGLNGVSHLAAILMHKLSWKIPYRGLPCRRYEKIRTSIWMSTTRTLGNCYFYPPSMTIFQLNRAWRMSLKYNSSWGETLFISLLNGWIV